MHILLAENQALKGSAVQSLLALAGHLVTRADSPAHALTILDLGAFPMVIIHGREADWDGLEFCHEIKARQRDHYIYTLVLAEPGQEADGIGVDDLLDSPFDGRTFLASLALAERWLNKHGAPLFPGLPFSDIGHVCA
ncbi:hypothetical protein [Geothrix sp. 21YS21S-2]|uniref:hypothetical protein n=1 Tax=Geothrix sp. 21YS21S-2 TaxID=3068893 RepID=UPI0027BAD55F|nr:hypothetical protein [Geothrix sp. 21YS21S-2]